MTDDLGTVSAVLARAWASVASHALLIVLPSILYVGISTGVAVALAGRNRSDVIGGVGAVVSFSLLGVILGFLTGNSRSPVVQALLPALLTFVAGIAAYLSSKETRATWRDIIPFSMVALLVAVLLSVSHGLALKRLSIEEERDFDQRRLDFEKVQLEVKKQLALRNLGLAGSAPTSSAPSKTP